MPKVEALQVGDPADEETDVGPVIDDDARERILAWIAEADGELLTGGDTTDDGLIRPTVIANPSPEAKVSCEEVFGPVVTLTRVGSLDEAIELANSTRYGLQAGIFTTNLEVRARSRAEARVRRRHDQRGADVPRRSDAVRRREGLRQHARRPCLRGARADRGAARRDRPLSEPTRRRRC